MEEVIDSGGLRQMGFVRRIFSSGETTDLGDHHWRLGGETAASVVSLG